MEKIRTVITEIKTSKKKLIIVISIAIILLLSLIAVLLGARTKNTKAKNQVQTVPIETKKYYASLKFEKETISQNDSSVSIILDMGANSVKSVSFTIEYDPTLLIADIEQERDDTSALSYSLVPAGKIASPDTAKKGTIRYVLSLKNGAVEQNGKGKIAKFIFKTKPEFTGNAIARIADIKIESDQLGITEEFFPQTNSLIIQSQ